MNPPYPVAALDLTPYLAIGHALGPDIQFLGDPARYHDGDGLFWCRHCLVFHANTSLGWRFFSRLFVSASLAGFSSIPMYLLLLTKATSPVVPVPLNGSRIMPWGGGACQHARLDQCGREGGKVRIFVCLCCNCPDAALIAMVWHYRQSFIHAGIIFNAAVLFAKLSAFFPARLVNGSMTTSSLAGIPSVRCFICDAIPTPIFISVAKPNTITWPPRMSVLAPWFFD